MIRLVVMWDAGTSAVAVGFQSSVGVPSSLVVVLLLLGAGLAVAGVTVSGVVYYLVRGFLPASARRWVVGALLGGALLLGAGLPLAVSAPFVLPGVGVSLAGGLLYLGGLTGAVGCAVLKADP